MTDKQNWYCSIALGVEYTAVKVERSTWPGAEWGEGGSIRYASCTIRSATQPSYEKFTIEFEAATGIALPQKAERKQKAPDHD